MMATQEQIEKVLRETDELLRAQVKKLGPLAGLAVGIVHQGQLVYTFNTGFADIKSHTPVTADTVFRIMSISKTFTAVALMQLWEQGKFQLDDPVNQHLKAIRVEHPAVHAPPITIRHLLTHTSGVGELRTLKPQWLYKPELMVLEDLSVRDMAEMPPLPTYYKGKLTAEIYPGIKWCYSNHAFGVLGQLIEDLSGQPFAQYIIDHIFKPLGMTQSDWFLSEIVRDRLATGYEFKDNSFKTIEQLYGYQHVVTAGASNIYSSVNDMVHYVAALMNGGANAHGRILQPETLALMIQPYFQLDARLPGQGLSFMLRNIGPHRTIGHSGGWAGFISQMLVAPDDELAVLVFTNTSNRAPNLIVLDLMRRLLSLPDPVTQLSNSTMPEHPELWGDLCGSYGPLPGPNTNFRHWNTTGAAIEVFVDGNHLVMRSPEGLYKDGVQLHPADANDPLVFEFTLQGLVQKLIFQRNAAGYINRLQTGLNDYHKHTAPVHWPLAEPLNQVQSAVRRRQGALVYWYMAGMPNKLKVIGRVMLALLALRWLWRRRRD